MTTKAPSSVQDFPPSSLEKIAYNSVAAVPTEEQNDRNRLGYHIWRWLTIRQGTLEQAVAESGARLQTSLHEAHRMIGEALKKQGIALDE